MGVTLVERLAAAGARLAGTQGAILCFHGLHAEGAPPSSSMHVSPDQFEAMVEAIRRVGRLVPLEEILSRHLAGRSTVGLVSLTADDAYVSLLLLEPLLRRQQIPLAVFAVSGALATGSRFWWDRVESAAAWADPERWRRFEDQCGLPEAYRIGQPASEGRTRPLRQWVLAAHAGVWPGRLEETLTRIEEEAGQPTRQRSMTEAELSGFLARSGAQLGVHTVSHAALPFLPDDELLRQVRQGHEALRERFPNVLPCLAIPFGLYDERTLRLVTTAGLTASLTLQGQTLDRPFDAGVGIPRICVVREHRPGKLALKASRLARPLQRLRPGTGGRYPVLPSATT